MATITINGRKYDWECVTIRGPHGLFIDITDLNYKGSQKKTRVYGKGGVSRGTARGNYEATGDMTILQGEYDRLAKSLPHGVLVTPFDIVLTLEPQGEPKRVIKLEDCQIDEVDEGHAQGEGDKGTKHSMTIGMIYRNGVPDYANS